MTAALSLAGVVLGVLLGALLGYWYSKREHLRELGVERYADYLDAFHAASAILWDVARDFHVGASDATSARQRIESAGDELNRTFLRAGFVASEEMRSRLRATFAACNSLSAAIVRTWPEPDIDECERLYKDASAEGRAFWQYCARELWGHAVPKPSADAGTLPTDTLSPFSE